MPKLDGWNAFQEMKKDDPKLKAIVATGYPNSEVRSAMARGELHDLFIKPYAVDTVPTRVSELTSSSSLIERINQKLKTPPEKTGPTKLP